LHTIKVEKLSKLTFKIHLKLLLKKTSLNINKFKVNFKYLKWYSSTVVINVLVCKVVRSFRSNFFLFIHLRGHGSASPKVQMIFFTFNQKKRSRILFFFIFNEKKLKGILETHLHASGLRYTKWHGSGPVKNTYTY
jgi:creatinine amidohydrolase/Fe(II)-dependent formamide hydrolase-like protein